MAADLVQVHEKYKTRGVAFVSITNSEKAGVADFVAKRHITWPSGYQALPETFGKFGAFTTTRMMPGYEVSPTLFLVDRQGVVVWCDGQARLLHHEPADIRRELELALDRLLAAPAGDVSVR